MGDSSLESQVELTVFRDILTMRTEGVFDAAARTEFLTGFRKRKKERQEKARLEMEEQIKEEKRQIKKEIREASNLHIHNAAVEDRLKNLRDIQGLSNETTIVKEAGGQEVEVCELGVVADLTDIAKGETQNVDEAEDAGEGEDTGKKGVSATRKKNLITKQRRLQTLVPQKGGRKFHAKAVGTAQKIKTKNVGKSKKN